MNFGPYDPLHDLEPVYEPEPMPWNGIFAFVATFMIFAGLMIGAVMSVHPERHADLAGWEEEVPYITDASCRFTNGDSGIRQASCLFVYSDGSEAEYWQPVTIKDGLIVAEVVDDFNSGDAAKGE